MCISINAKCSLDRLINSIFTVVMYLTALSTRSSIVPSLCTYLDCFFNKFDAITCKRLAAGFNLSFLVTDSRSTRLFDLLGVETIEGFFKE